MFARFINLNCKCLQDLFARFIQFCSKKMFEERGKQYFFVLH
jgi:hypothetical protein